MTSRWAVGRYAAVIWLVALAGASTCSAEEPVNTTLRVLASEELADMRPILDEMRRETGIGLDLVLRGTVDASNMLAAKSEHYDLAWLSSDRYLQLKWKKMGAGEQPLSTNIMLSPVVVGVKPHTAEVLRSSAQEGQVSWADIADGAASGSLRFGMADPRHHGSGLAALIGVATAAAGKGVALTPDDVTCDRLRGFLTGLSDKEMSPVRIENEFVEHRGDLDAVIDHESKLMQLNDRLTEKLEIIYPRDGMIQAEHPLLLIDPARRAAYDKVVEWLKSSTGQKRIMERTLRRPLDPTILLVDRLTATPGTSLYFPDQQDVIDQLLTNYDDARLQIPTRVIFVLDFSRSMVGARLADLRSTFAGLSGADGERSGGFFRFYAGEQFTIIRFGGRVLAEQDFTISTEEDLSNVRAFIGADDLDGSTAVWSALDHAYARASMLVRETPQQTVAIVLMTDGESNAGLGIDEFLSRQEARRSSGLAVRTYTIRYGEGNAGELGRIATVTNGRPLDATASSLLDAFKEIRGCR